jgi:hypothetical protein
LLERETTFLFSQKGDKLICKKKVKGGLFGKVKEGLIGNKFFLALSILVRYFCLD